MYYLVTKHPFDPLVLYMQICQKISLLKLAFDTTSMSIIYKNHLVIYFSRLGFRHASATFCSGNFIGISMHEFFVLKKKNFSMEFYDQINLFSAVKRVKLSSKHTITGRGVFNSHYLISFLWQIQKQNVIFSTVGKLIQ